jgi:hypothetical protein
MVVRYPGPRTRRSYACIRGSADHAEPACQGLSDGRDQDMLVAGQLLTAVAGVVRERAELARQ